MSASQTEITTFVAVSSLLTGIAASKLSPTLDPTDVKTIYFNYAKQQDPIALARLLEIFEVSQSEGKTPDQTAAAIFASDVAWFARSVMLAWYLADWYQPEDLRQYAAAAAKPLTPSNPNPPQAPNGTVISSVAYTQGWAWNVAQAHPMGFSNLRFGYWSQTPPSLPEFIGGQQ